MEDTRSVVFNFLFLFLCVLLFSWLVFSMFRKLSNISSTRYFSVEAYPFKNICQMEIFVNVYLPNYLINILFNLINYYIIFGCDSKHCIAFYRPAVSLHPPRGSPHFGWILPASPLARIISLFLNNFQTLPAKSPCLK